MKLCYLCKQIFYLWDVHKQQCTKRTVIEEESISFLKLTDFLICKKCWQRVEHTDRQYHRRNCKRLMKNNKTITNISLNRSQLDFSLTNKKQPIISHTQQAIKQKQVVNSLINISNQIFKIFLNSWIEQTSHISPIAVSKIFTAQLHQTCTKLSLNIPKLNIENLHKKFKGKLVDIIKKTNDIFDIQRVKGLIQKSNISQHMKRKIFIQFNQFLNLCKFEKRYKIQRLQNQKQRQIIVYREFIMFVIELFRSRMKKKIHFGLDLLIIFHSGQRFPSSFNQVKKGIINIMKSNQNYSIIQKQTKTSKKGTLIIAKSLKKLLKKFKWQGFFLEKWQIQHLSRYVNFSSLILRRGYFIQGVNFLRKNLDPSLMTGHSSQHNSNIYIQELLLKQKIDFHESLIIPFTQKEFQQIKRFDLIHKIKPELLNEQIFQNDQLIDDWPDFEIEFNLGNIEEQTIQINEALIEQIQSSSSSQQQFEQKQNKHNSPQKMNLKRDITLFNVNGFKIVRKQNKFDFSSNYINGGGNNNLSCIYCKRPKNSEQNFCNCLKFNTNTTGVTINSKQIKNSQLQLKMPSKYLKNQYLFNQVRFFLHRRGNYVTNVAVTTNPIQFKDSEKAQKINLKLYKQYADGKYFPPLQINISGDQNLNGTGVGLYATQDIEPDVFIGEYGGDIVNFQQTVLLKRLDMTMCLSIKNSLQIGTIKHASYIQLLNTSQKPNCKAIKCVVDKRLIIIIYSIEKILQGDELLYNYAGDFPVTFEKELIIYKDKINQGFGQQMLDQAQQNKQENIYNIGNNMQQVVVVDEGQFGLQIKAKGTFKQIYSIRQQINCCYAFVILVIFRFLKDQISGDQYFAKKFIHKKVCETSEMMKLYKPKQQYLQNDAMQFFQFVNNMLYRNSPFPTLILQEVFVCLECSCREYKFCQEKVIYIGQNQDYGQIILDEVTKKCGKCESDKTFSHKKRIISDPSRLVFSFKRFDNKLNKLHHQINYKQWLQIKQHRFTPEYIIFHQGNSINSGHFYLLHCKSNCYINMNKIYECKNVLKQNIYAIIYRRFEDNYKELSNLDTNDLGQKFYEIASIVKLFVVLVAIKLQNKFSISPHRKIRVTDKYFPNSTQLQIDGQVEIIDLYKNCLVVSCCRSALSLANFFGDKLKQTKQQYLDSQQIFMNQINDFLKDNSMIQTFISDSTGLEPSISTVKDLQILLNLVKENQNICQIIESPSIIVNHEMVYNTNKLLPKVLGKTGFTKNKRFNFIGFAKKTKQNLICLNFQRQKLWRILQNRFK